MKIRLCQVIEFFAVNYSVLETKICTKSRLNPMVILVLEVKCGARLARTQDKSCGTYAVIYVKTGKSGKKL